MPDPEPKKPTAKELLDRLEKRLEWNMRQLVETPEFIVRATERKARFYEVNATNRIIRDTIAELEQELKDL